MGSYGGWPDPGGGGGGYPGAGYGGGGYTEAATPPAPAGGWAPTPPPPGYPQHSANWPTYDPQNPGPVYRM